MENGENNPLVEKELLSESSALSENLKIMEILELCFQPETKEELDNILLNFREKLKYSSENEYFCRFDNISMYTLAYVYKHDTASFTSVSRSLFLYQMQYQLVLKGTNRNLIFNCDKDCFLKELRQFTNLHTYSKREDMLVDVGLGSILSGNLGLSLYLVKFGLMEFPLQVNEKCRKMFEILVGMFNSCSKPLAANMQADNRQTSVRLDELLNQLKEKENNIRKSMLIFSILVVVAEYLMYEKIEVELFDLKLYTKHKKDLCLQKLKCIDVFFQATTETIITFKDIKNFTEVFLNPFITAEIGQSLVETSGKILDEGHNYNKPRCLKDLARFKVRSSLQNSMSIPEQVHELKIPVVLKEFLNFNTEGIWELLVINHLNLSFEQKLNRIPEIEGRNVRELEDGNVRELEDGNVQELHDGNAREIDDVNLPEFEDGNLEDGNLQDLEDGNLQDLEDGNLQDLEDGNWQDLEDGNLQELEDGNLQELEDCNLQELEDINLSESEH